MLCGLTARLSRPFKSTARKNRRKKKGESPAAVLVVKMEASKFTEVLACL
jgi:hypothetical protein